jgi:hypothetical protein
MPNARNATGEMLRTIAPDDPYSKVFELVPNGQTPKPSKFVVTIK